MLTNRSIKSLFLALVVILHFESAEADFKTAQSVFAGYRENSDQQVVQVFPANASSESIIVLYKQYLEPRKVKANPALGDKVEYLIYDSRANKSISLINVHLADKPIIGKIVKTNDGFLIPIFTGDKDFKLFKYSLSQQSVGLINIRPFALKNGVVKQIFHISNGYIALVDAENKAKLVYQPYDAENRMVLDFEYLQLPTLSIEDVAEASGYVYLVAKAAKLQGETVSFVYRVNDKFAAESLKVAGLDIDSKLSQHALFISTSHSHPSLQVLTRKRDPGPPSLYLFKISETARLVWRFDFDEIEAGSGLQVAGICGDRYIFSRRVKSNGRISNSAEFRLLNAQGQEMALWTRQILANGSVINVAPESIGGNIYAVSNYSKQEDARRNDGWYSWLGFQIDNLPAVDLCNTR